MTVIEARQLGGLNMDPVVCVQVSSANAHFLVKTVFRCMLIDPNVNPIEHRKLGICLVLLALSICYS